jgi:hypothetical protein
MESPQLCVLFRRLADAKYRQLWPVSPTLRLRTSDLLKILLQQARARAGQDLALIEYPLKSSRPIGRT